MKKIAALAFSIFLFCSQSSAQSEFFVSVDPSDGSFHKISMFSEVNWIHSGSDAYSQSLHRFYFAGGDAAGKWRYYTVDAYTGAVINRCAFPDNDPDFDGFSAVTYNDADNRVYGLSYNKQTKVNRLVSVDPQNLSYRTVCELPIGMSHGLYAAIDKVNNRYLFTSYDSIGSLCVVDISSGTILSVKALPLSADQMRFDNGNGLLYGLGTNGDKRVVISVDPITCSYSIIRTMGEEFRGSGAFTYDELNKTYSYLAVDLNSASEAVVTINTTNGALTYIPQNFPLKKRENVISWQYDNTLNKIFALHWGEGSMPEGRKTIVYPNPFNYYATAYLDSTYTSAACVLYSVDGKKVQEYEGANTKKIPIDRSNLANGTYFMKIYGDGKFLGVEKVVVE